MAAARPGSLPDLKSLIRPDHIRNAGSIFPGGEEQKQKYISGVTKLWETIDNHNPDSGEHHNAHQKLIEVTINIRNYMQRRNQPGGAQAVPSTQQNGARPASSGQPGQPGQQEARAPAQNTQGGSQSQTSEPFSARVIEEVKKLNIITPPNLNGNDQAARQWVRDAQQKYAHHLHRSEVTAKKLAQLHQAAALRNQQGKPLDSRETENYQGQVARMEATQTECKHHLGGFQKQQEVYRNQHAQLQANSGGNAASNTSQAPNASAPSQNHVGGGPSQAKQEPQGQPHTVTSAVDAARNQGNPAARSGMSPPNNGQPTQPTMTQLPNSRPPPGQNQISHSHPPLNINTNPRPQDQQHNSPRVAPSQPSAMAPEAPAVPLSHSAAVEQARSYSQPNIAQQTPQSATHGPSDQRNQNNHAKMPIPKDLNLQPTQPVSVGPSRPTLTNGPVAMGPLGQPAIQRHPGYVLEGDGERVLSKKKLEELVRQVTGGTGGEAEEGEGLTAEVEETLLQVADEFVDQVIVAACRLAKLRQSSTLELRDLQLILERNYNIRVPGYASDELRTVKKVIPAQAWTQKLSAVQAAKVTGGKGDL